MPDQPVEDITALQPKDWMETFLDVFRDDTTYGFCNRNDPTKNVFKAHNVVFSIPESILQFPSLWIACEEFESTGEEIAQTTADFLYDFNTYVDIYGIVQKNTHVSYDDKDWVVPGLQYPEATNNVLFLLMTYIGKKILDNPDIKDVSKGITINPMKFVSGEFFYSGMQALREVRAVRLGFKLGVQLEWL